MHLLEGLIVDLRLGPRESFKDLGGALLDGVRQKRCAVDHTKDLRKMAVGLLFAPLDMEFGGADAPAFGLLDAI